MQTMQQQASSSPHRGQGRIWTCRLDHRDRATMSKKTRNIDIGRKKAGKFLYFYTRFLSESDKSTYTF
jgi:hypothetical protein